MTGSTQAMDIVLGGPPDLTAGSGRFFEVETDDGHSIAIGQTGTGPCGSTAYPSRSNRAPPPTAPTRRAPVTPIP
jgi:hypothetical protein